MDRINTPVQLPNPMTATYNQANQMNAYNAEALRYDENGNLIQKGATTYEWDARNRLIAINGPDMQASFKYDALGRRIEKTINGETIRYLYDGLDIVQEIKDGMVYSNYVRTLHIDEPLVRTNSDGTVRYYQRDALGSVTALTDEMEAIKTQYIYDPYGNTEQIGEGNDNPFQYTGRENDGTGLYYYRARYYSPELQKFVSEDPIGFMGGDVNLYRYVKSNPLNITDPIGFGEFYCFKKTDGSIECGFTQDPKAPPEIKKIVLKVLPYGVGVSILFISESPEIAALATWGTEQVVNYCDEKPVSDPYLGIEWFNPPKLNDVEPNFLNNSQNKNGKK